MDIIEEIPESEAAIRQTEATASKKEISNNSIPQKSDLSTPVEKKYDLADDGAVRRPKKKSVKTADKSTGQAVGSRKSGTVVSEYVKSYAKEFGLNEATKEAEAYAKKLSRVMDIVSNPDNMELEIERGLSEISATGEKHPNTSNELPSKNSIPQKSDLSTPD